MKKYRFHITGPDEPHDKQKLPWRIVVYEWTSAHKDVIGFYSTHSGPFEFATVDEAVHMIHNFTW